jgi:hypothetical protein
VLSSTQVEAVDEWLRMVLWEYQLPGETVDPQGSHFEIHRLKGRLVLDNGSQKMIQGVRELFDIIDNPSSEASEPGQGKMILIGRHLEKFDFGRSLLAAIERSRHQLQNSSK